MRLIKKYSNRRLYDTGASTYVNLEDLARLVREGERLEVVDAKTGHDLTREVLLQVVVEVDGGLELFPVGLLHRVVRFGGHAPMQRVFMKQLGAGMALLDAQLERFEQQLGWMGQGPVQGAASAPGAAPGSREAGPSHGDPPPDGDEPPPEDEPPDEPASQRAAGQGADSDLNALRDRLQALEARLKR